MLLYTEVRKKRGKFLGLTSLTDKEFQALLAYFEAAYQAKYEGKKTQLGKKRQCAVGGGQKGVLPSIEQKLLFILVYQKTYPVQIVMAELFGMSQSSANEWIKRLLPILGNALAAMDVLPERDGKQFAKTEARRAQKLKYIIDGTERRRQRPKDAVKQALHYSGKKKVHSDKNLVIVQASSKRIGYLSPTHPGKTHDKKVADSEHIRYPRNAKLYKDTGFQGYEPKQTRTYQPKKIRLVEN
jgi:Helix-turn-helix of DDE superfamily endonuclease/DDE superfamily endonuclease